MNLNVLAQSDLKIPSMHYSGKSYSHHQNTYLNEDLAKRTFFDLNLTEEFSTLTIEELFLLITYISKVCLHVTPCLVCMEGLSS